MATPPATLFIIVIVVLYHFIYLAQCKSLYEDGIQSFRNGSIDKIDVTCDYGYTLSDGVCTECGKSDYKPNSRIVGGISAVPHSWPAHALVIQSYKQTYDLKPLGGQIENITVQFKCGGTLINSYTILTAAHCIVYDFNYPFNGIDLTFLVIPNDYYPTFESMFDIYLGAHDTSFLFDSPSPPSNVQHRKIARIIKYPTYNIFTYLNDIALLILSEPVELNSYVKLACLPQSNSKELPQNNQDVVAMGWGTLSLGGLISDDLQNVKLKIYDPMMCEPVLSFIRKDWNRQLCAGDMLERKDTCQGDSGGGIYAFDAKINRSVIVGITSYGDGCAQPDSPGIYTRVSYYVDWIKENAKPVATTTYPIISFNTTTKTTIITTTSISSTTDYKPITTKIWYPLLLSYSNSNIVYYPLLLMLNLFLFLI